MKLTVKFFAAARDISGTSDLVITMPGDTTPAEVLEALMHTYPRLVPLKEYLRMAVNWEYVPPHHPLAEGDEVAIIPPVSGG